MNNSATTIQERESLNKIITIPNLLSMFRLGLIPVIVWLYCAQKKYLWTAAVLVLSGITDMADGFIARHFNAVSNVGKVLDPMADKLTQLAVLICLLTRFPLMMALIVLLFCKELFMGLTGLLVIKRTNHVYGAEWHGKAATFLLYGIMFVHVLWFDIPASISNTFIGICTIMMVISFVLYGIRNITAIRRRSIS